MKKIFSFSRIFGILTLLFVSLGSVWAETAVKTETFENYTTSTSYNGQMNLDADNSACGIAWFVEHGTPATNDKITGSNSLQMRAYWAKNSAADAWNGALPYLESKTAVAGLTNIAFKTRTDNTNMKFDVYYKTDADGAEWTKLGDTHSFTQTGLQGLLNISADIPSSSVEVGYFIKIAVNSTITHEANPTKTGNIKLVVDDIAFTYTKPEGGDPAIIASDVTIESDATSGEISFTIDYPTSATATASLTSGNWISNVAVNSSTSKVTFDSEVNATRQARTATITLSYEGAEDKEVTVTQKGYVITEIVDVTGAMTWDFSGYTKDVQTTPGTEVILGNYVTLTTGNADALKGDQQYIVRNNYCWQGTKLTFHPTVAGVVEVVWSSTSGTNHRTLKINNGDYAVPGGSTSTSKDGGVTTTEFVPANQDVVLTGWDFKNDEYTSNQIRIWTLKFTPADQVTVTDAQYATYFNANHAVELPTGVEGYVWDNGLVKVYDAATTDKVIPAGEPVVLKAAAGKYTLNYTTTETPTYKSINSNDLQGAATAMTADDMTAANPAAAKFYALSLNAAGEASSVGFYWINEGGAAFDIAAGKAYLALPSTAAPARFLFNETTAIENNAEVVKANKTLVNGRLFILRDGKTFDIMGRIIK